MQNSNLTANYELYVKLRDKKHVTNYCVGQEAGVPRSMFCRWEKGGKIQRKTLKKLADYFGVEIESFYEDYENENAENCSCVG